jgi:hypothetical protein
MGRGEHPWKNHHKKLNAESLRLKAQGQKAISVRRYALSAKNCILGVVIGISLLIFHFAVETENKKKLKHTGN